MDGYPAQGLDRRALVAGLGAFGVYALANEAKAAGRITDGRLPARRWILRQDELARGLRSGSVSARAWHDAVNGLAREVDVPALMAEMRPGEAGTPFMRDPVKRQIHFLDGEGRPQKLGYAAATFSFGPDNVITPHAHRNMASAHMVIAGRVRIRTFDRVGDSAEAIAIRPTGDRVAWVGEAAAMTTEIDNIHWFTPASARAMTFDVIVDGLATGPERYVIEPLDPVGGVSQPDGTILAPRLDFAESMRRYTARL